MPVFKSIKELNEYFKDKILRNVLENEMAKMVKEVEQENIQSKVYDVYEPKEYERRYERGGMIDDENIVAEVSDDGTILEVRNITPPHPEFTPDDQNIIDLPALIEFGHESTYRGTQQFYEFGTGKEPFSKPRPFTGATIEQIKEEGLHVKTLKEALQKRGIQTK